MSATSATPATATRRVMINIAFSQLRRHPGRIVAVLLAVMISVGYLTATLSFLATETAAIGRQLAARTAGADVVVSSDELSARQLGHRVQTVRRTPGVADAELSYQLYGNIDQRSTIELQSLPRLDQLRWAKLTTGSWPTRRNQIAIGKTAAEQQNLGVGGTIRVDLGNGPQTFTVSGITDEQKSLFSGKLQTGFLLPAAIDPQQAQADLLVIGDGSTSANGLAEALDQRLGSKITVQTSAAYGQQQVKDMAQGADVLRNLLLIFGCIALLVGTILIVNTFLILLAQRRRQIGLLRAVGATGRQVRRSVLIEALITGLIGSALGIGLGVGVSAVAAGISGSLAGGLVIPPTVLAAGLIGVLVTVLAAIGPARRATRVSPLEALRPVGDAADTRRGSVISGVVATLLAVVGGGLIVLGLRGEVQTLLVCIAGSALLAVAILVGVKLYFPALLRVIGKITAPLGPVGRLATANTARNPGRAAATGAALMLATGLIVTLQVGSASVKASTSATLDQHYPVDVTVSASTKPLPAGLDQKITKIVGIQSAVVLNKTMITVKPAGQPSRKIPILAGDHAASVINPGAGQVPADRLLLDPVLAQSMGIRSGDRVQVRHGAVRQTMIAEPNRIAADYIGVVSPAVMHRLAPNPTPGAVWAKAAPSADITKITSALNRLLQDQPDLQLSGSLTQKAAYETLLDTLLTIATVLLGVAVVIALIGVGNTLGLSVLERSRESALLRALGLQRRQLRLMLAIEAVLLAFAGAAVGIVAGAFFGWVGSAALGSELDYTTTYFSMSLGQTLAVAGVAIVAGVLASVLPARRAARSAPVDALAET
ncbi:FtsX-like permease family protein [Microlunatus elymi]|uniref:FtsX-like permease family protein n=1 Tax=Microlunatus elymi TaxID=2596828 RepID=A0A516PUH5_9ACTN|nr:FtsX-like permease family protein [Microlunatus elymi]QDP94780.1 FtsX-like permease family protein [Microlunatus elymi]